MADINYCPQSDCGLAWIWIISLICKFFPKERDVKKRLALRASLFGGIPVSRGNLTCVFQGCLNQK